MSSQDKDPKQTEGSKGSGDAPEDKKGKGEGKKSPPKPGRPLNPEAPPVLVYSHFKGLKSLSHVERKPKSVGEKEPHTSHYLLIYPGLNILRNDKSVVGDEGKRASIWEKLVLDNEPIQLWIAEGRMQDVPDFTKLTMERQMKFVLATGRLVDLEYILDMDLEPDVAAAVEDEIAALDEKGKKTEREKRDRRRVRRKEKFD